MVPTTRNLTAPPTPLVRGTYKGSTKGLHYWSFACRLHYWPFARGIHRSPVDSPREGSVMCKAFFMSWRQQWHPVYVRGRIDGGIFVLEMTSILTWISFSELSGGDLAGIMIGVILLTLVVAVGLFLGVAWLLKRNNKRLTGLPFGFENVLYKMDGKWHF